MSDSEFSASTLREKAKEKARRLTATGDPHQRIGATSWTPGEPAHTEAKTGLRPISQRQFKAGGAVNAPRADRKARKSGGSVNADAYANTDIRKANEERPGVKHVGGFASGGRTGRDVGGGVPTQRFNFSPVAPGEMARAGGLASGGRAHADAAEDKAQIKATVKSSALKGHPDSCKCARCMGGRAGKAEGGWIAGATKNKGALHRELGVPEGQKIPAKKLAAAAHSDNPTERKRANLAKTLKSLPRADGGRTALKHGGKASKGKMNVNIVIAPQGGGGQPSPATAQQPPPMPPRPPMPIPTPPPGGMPPGGMPMGVGIPMPMSGGPMPPGGGMPPMPRKRGGGVTNVSTGSGGGLARLEKIKDYGLEQRK